MYESIATHANRIIVIAITHSIHSPLLPLSVRPVDGGEEASREWADASTEADRHGIDGWVISHAFKEEFH